MESWKIICKCCFNMIEWESNLDINDGFSMDFPLPCLITAEGKRASTALLTWDVHVLAPWRSLSQGDCSKLGRIPSYVDKPDFLAIPSPQPRTSENSHVFFMFSAPPTRWPNPSTHWRPPSTRMATTWPRWAFPAWSRRSRSGRRPWKKSCSRCWKICRTGRCAPRVRADFFWDWGIWLAIWLLGVSSHLVSGL